MDQLGSACQFRDIHDQLNQFWNDLGVPHLDLLPVYERDLSQSLVVNRFDAPPNELAHQIATEAMGNFLVQRIGKVAR